MAVSVGRAWHCCRPGSCRDITPRRAATWLLPALLLLQVPGCLSLSGPRRVTGTEGESLSVQCRYEKEFTDHDKYWCQGPCFISPRFKIVETTASEREVRRGHVSIRDHPANLTFTVTLESLTKGDEGRYWCGITAPARNLIYPVEVSVSPAQTLMITTSRLGPLTSLTVTTGPSMTSQETTDDSQYPRSLLSSVHFLILIFLKVPLFLGMLSAVLWVNRPQRQTCEETQMA